MGSCAPLRTAITADCSRRPLLRLAASSSGPHGKRGSLVQYYTIGPIFRVALLIGNNLLAELEYNIQT